MNFFNPWGFLFAILIPGIILLYLLKQQHEDVVISSTFLWDKTLEDIQASMPWQRLRRNILLFLQLLIITLFVLAVARPFLARQGEGGNYIIILDCSASMQAQDVKPSRFEKARDEIEAVIDGMLPGEKMTLIAAGRQARIVVNQTRDRAVLKRYLREIKVTNGTADIQNALSLAQAIEKELKDTLVYLYSDQDYRLEGENHLVFPINNGGRNCAVTGVSYTHTHEGPVVLSKITNYGERDSFSVECVVDGLTLDVREVTIEAMETTNIYWKGIPSGAEKVEVSIIDKDDLMVDNKGWAVLDVPKKNKVLLVTKRNAFLEKAIKLRSDLKLEKTTFEQADGMEGYQLYVYDGYLPSKLPKDGSVIIFNPKGEVDYLKINGKFMPGSLQLRRQSSHKDIVEYLQVDQFRIAESTIIEVPDWGEVVLDDGENPLMVVGENGAQRIAVFPFDIHYSDLPLRPDFPILIQNLMGWMLPQVVDSDIRNFAGQDVNINPLPHAQSVRVVMPSGRIVKVAPPFPVAPFSETLDVGIYKVEQELEVGTVDGYFTIQVPTHIESNLKVYRQEVEMGEPLEGNKQKPVARRELWHYLVWAVLALILVEWWVYQRGY